MLFSNARVLHVYFIRRYSIMLNCWNQEPTDRPSFADLAELLSDFLQSQTKSVSKLNCLCSSTCYNNVIIPIDY